MLVRNIRSRLAPSRKDNPVFGNVTVSGLRSPAWSDTNYQALAKEGYVQNVDVHACVSLIADSFGGVKWTVCQKKRSGNSEIINDGPLYELIKRPNPQMGMAEFFGALAAYRELAGNTYVFRWSVNNKPPSELWPLRPDRTKIVPSGNASSPIEMFVYDGAQRLKFEPDKNGHTVMHWKTFHPLDDFYGLSPVQVAARSVDQSNSAQAWNVSLFQNSCQPSGAMVTPELKFLGDDQFDRLRDQLDREYSGSVNAGKPMLLEGGLKWVQMSLNPAEMAWLDGDERTTIKIASVFRVDPELIGRRSKGGMNDTNFLQARRKLWMENVLPKMDNLRDHLNLWLTPLFGDDKIFIDYDRDDIEAIQEDRDIVHTRANNAFKSSLITRNEGRAMINQPPDPDGDVYAVPTTVQLVRADGTLQVAGAVTPPQIAAPAPGKKGRVLDAEFEDVDMAALRGRVVGLLG